MTIQDQIQESQFQDSHQGNFRTDPVTGQSLKPSTTGRPRDSRMHLSGPNRPPGRDLPRQTDHWTRCIGTGPSFRGVSGQSSNQAQDPGSTPTSVRDCSGSGKGLLRRTTKNTFTMKTSWYPIPPTLFPILSTSAANVRATESSMTVLIPVLIPADPCPESMAVLIHGSALLNPERSEREIPGTPNSTRRIPDARHPVPKAASDAKRHNASGSDTYHRTPSAQRHHFRLSKADRLRPNAALLAWETPG